MTPRLKRHYLNLLKYCGEMSWPYCTGRYLELCQMCAGLTASGPVEYVCLGHAFSARNYIPTKITVCDNCAAAVLRPRRAWLRERNERKIRAIRYSDYEYCENI